MCETFGLGCCRSRGSTAPGPVTPGWAGDSTVPCRGTWVLEWHKGRDMVSKWNRECHSLTSSVIYLKWTGEMGRAGGGRREYCRERWEGLEGQQESRAGSPQAEAAAGAEVQGCLAWLRWGAGGRGTRGCRGGQGGHGTGHRDQVEGVEAWNWPSPCRCSGAGLAGDGLSPNLGQVCGSHH